MNHFCSFSSLLYVRWIIYYTVRRAHRTGTRFHTNGYITLICKCIVHNNEVIRKPTIYIHKPVSESQHRSVVHDSRAPSPVCHESSFNEACMPIVIVCINQSTWGLSLKDEAPSRTSRSGFSRSAISPTTSTLPWQKHQPLPHHRLSLPRPSQHRSAAVVLHAVARYDPAVASKASLAWSVSVIVVTQQRQSAHPMLPHSCPTRPGHGGWSRHSTQARWRSMILGL